MSTIQPSLFDSTGSAFTPLAVTRSEVQAPKHDECPLVRYVRENAESAEKFIIRHLEKNIDFMISIHAQGKEGYFYVVQLFKGKLKTNKRPMPEEKIQKFIAPIFRENYSSPFPKIGRYSFMSCPWEKNYLEGSAGK